MNEVIQCPSCQRRLQVPEELLGQDVQCPTCGSTFVAALGHQARPTPYSPIQEPSATPTPQEEPPFIPMQGERPAPPPLPGESGRSQYDSGSGSHNDYGSGRVNRRRRDYAPHRGGIILTLGILSFFPICIFTGPIAWIMANQDLTDMRLGRMDPEGEGLTQAGRVCGIISTLILVLILGFMCLGMMASVR